MFIDSRTGRTLSPGQGVSLLTPHGFTEGVLDGVTLHGNVRVRAAAGVHEVRLDDVEAIWPLRAVSRAR